MYLACKLQEGGPRKRPLLLRKKLLRHQEGHSSRLQNDEEGHFKSENREKTVKLRQMRLPNRAVKTFQC